MFKNFTVTIIPFVISIAVKKITIAYYFQSKSVNQYDLNL